MSWSGVCVNKAASGHQGIGLRRRVQVRSTHSDSEYIIVVSVVDANPLSIVDSVGAGSTIGLDSSIWTINDQIKVIDQTPSATRSACRISPNQRGAERFLTTIGAVNGDLIGVFLVVAD